MSVTVAATVSIAACVASFIPVTAADLPEAVQVEDGRGETLHIQLERLVDGGELVSRFGWRRHPMGGGGVHHDGIDIKAHHGALVRAAAPGTIVEVARGREFGRFVRIRHAGHFETVYAHLSAVPRGLKMGQPVTSDDVIGFVGSTGRSTGPHLHFEVRRSGHAIDPLTGEPRRPAKPTKKARSGGT